MFLRKGITTMVSKKNEMTELQKTIAAYHNTKTQKELALFSSKLKEFVDEKPAVAKEVLDNICLNTLALEPKSAWLVSALYGADKELTFNKLVPILTKTFHDKKLYPRHQSAVNGWLTTFAKKDEKAAEEILSLLCPQSAEELLSLLSSKDAFAKKDRKAIKTVLLLLGPQKLATDPEAERLFYHLLIANPRVIAESTMPLLLTMFYDPHNFGVCRKETLSALQSIAEKSPEHFYSNVDINRLAFAPEANELRAVLTIPPESHDYFYNNIDIDKMAFIPEGEWLRVTLNSQDHNKFKNIMLLKFANEFNTGTDPEKRETATKWLTKFVVENGAGREVWQAIKHERFDKQSNDLLKAMYSAAAGVYGKITDSVLLKTDELVKPATSEQIEISLKAVETASTILSKTKRALQTSLEEKNTTAERPLIKPAIAFIEAVLEQ